MDTHILDGLNEEQRKAVEYCGGAELVIAGAGSGKTRVLTHKIAYLIQEKGFRPWNILALTFTNKAANEMKSRIGALIGEESARMLYMGTFHSVFSRILRSEADRLGYERNFTIYDDSDSKSLLKAIVKEMQLDDKIYKSSSLYSKISMAKNNLLLAEDYVNNARLMQGDRERRMPQFAAVYSAYCARCKKANAMDFDDLLVNTYLLFNRYDEVRRKYAGRFLYILVDEYQDTNSVQQKIVWQLSKEHLNVCAVGDDAQSIYAFRGANIDNILGFKDLFPGTKLFKLERNYRSTQNIVLAANSLIARNERQIRKDVYSCNAKGNKIVLKPSYSDREEAIIVCNEIKRLRKEENYGYDDFAVLYRTNAQSRSFEEAMRKVGIPYRIYGGLSFYQRKEIKDVIAYLRMVVNPNDEEAFKRVINYPKRGLGDTTIAKIASAATEKGVSLWDVLGNPGKNGLSVSKATLSKLFGFRSMISGFIEKSGTEDVYVLSVEIIKASGISNDIYSDRTTENVARQENVEELLGSMQEFVESRKEEGRENEIYISDFLQEVSLQTDLESEENEQEGKVSLMTVHSAKGLEFPAVFVVGMEENIFPSMLSSNNIRELEEERRLLYVAITRAEKHCMLTYAMNRYRYGKMEVESPSRFLCDIDPSLLDVESPTDVFMRASGANSFRGNGRFNKPVAPMQSSKPEWKASQSVMPNTTAEVASMPRPRKISPMSSAASRMGGVGHLPEVAEGCTIEHERFGIGQITRLEGSGENAKATVRFNNAGVKQLLLKFARFKVISGS